jgi:hypothetical protein
VARRSGYSTGHEVMIRRGLQITFVVGIMALGAAPSFGQTNYNHWPSSISLSGFPIFEGQNVNGYWVLVGSGMSGTTSEFTLWDDQANTTIARLRFTYTFSTGNMVGVISIDPSFSGGGFRYSRTLTSWGNNPLPASITGWANVNGAPPAVSAAAFPSMVADEFASAFPDWASATQKVPLGFSMGMAFWATALALTIPMKWVKELASASS